MSQPSVDGQSLVLDTHSGPIRVWQHGSHDDTKAPLVFLQGFMAGPDAWIDTMRGLACDRRHITVDWPFGAHREALRASADTSPPGVARLVVEVLDRLGIERAVLIGNDSGGVIAQLVVASAAQRVAALVLISCDAFETFPPGQYRLLFRLAPVPGVVAAMARMMSVAAFATSRFGYGAVMAHEPARALPWVRPLASDAAVRRDLGKLMAGSSNRQTMGAAKCFADFDRPAMVVWGENDRLFPRRLGQRLAGAFPRGRFEVVTDSATFVPLDQPTRLASLLNDFVAEVPE
jgi:pimeloyl-ACP methyl ester carboxylesterase